MKYINFSLWGNDPTYTIGMLKNIPLAKEIYSDWKVVIYCKNIPNDIYNELKKNDVILVDSSNDRMFGTFWRFIPFEDYEYFIVRDADSRISKREYNAVQEWIKSGKTMHMMRDHPHHGTYMMAGMWGLKRDESFNIKEELTKWFDINGWNPPNFDYDRYFLEEVIYKRYINDQICHDSCFTEFPNSKPFPSKMENLCFVGEKFHADDTPFHQRQDWVNRKELGY